MQLSNGYLIQQEVRDSYRDFSEIHTRERETERERERSSLIGLCPASLEG